MIIDLKGASYPAGYSEPWFAWYPVVTNRNKLVWMEYVIRTRMGKFWHYSLGGK